MTELPIPEPEVTMFPAYPPPTLLPKQAGVISAQNTSKAPLLLSPWTLKHGISILRVADHVRGISGNFVQTIGYRFAEVTITYPGAWIASALTRSSNTEGTRDIDVSAVTDQMWVQVALLGHTTDGNLGYSTSGLQVCTNGRGQVIGGRTIEVQPDLNSNQTAYFPIGGLVPVMGMTSLMFTVVASGVTGTLTYQPAWRTYASNRVEPGAWSTLGSNHSSTTNEGHNFGRLTITPGTNLWAETALALTASGSGKLTVLVAAEY